jgi:hypothetical protein
MRLVLLKHGLELVACAENESAGGHLLVASGNELFEIFARIRDNGESTNHSLIRREVVKFMGGEGVANVEVLDYERSLGRCSGPGVDSRSVIIDHLK